MANQHNFPLIGQAFLGTKILSASITLSGTDSGKAFSNASASGAITVILPQAKPGYTFQFLEVAAHNVVVTPQSTDNIRGLGAGASATLSSVASLLWLECINTGTWEILQSLPLPSGVTFAAPTALVGLTAIPGSASTAMRSDAAPALNVTISPTWTGNHVFQGNGGLFADSATVQTYIGYSQSGVAKAFVGVALAAASLVSDAVAGDLVIRDDATGTIRFTISAGSGTQLLLGNGGMLSHFGVGAQSAVAAATQVFINGGNSASFGWCNHSNTADNKIFDSFVDGAATLHLRVVNDAYNAATDWATIVRAGLAVNSITFGSGANVVIGIPTAGAGLTLHGTGTATILQTQNGSTGNALAQHLGLSNFADADFNIFVTQVGATNKAVQIGPSVNVPIQIVTAGTLRASIQAGLFMAGATGGDQGSGTGNFTNLFINGAAIAPATAVAAATETRTSTVTQTNSTQLTLAIAAAGKYAVKLVASFTSGTAAGVAVGLNYSGTFTAAASNVGYFSAPSTAGTAGGDGNQFDSAPAARLSVAGINAAPQAAVFTAEGTLTVTGAGTLAMSFAQQSSSANVTTLLIGSYLQIIKIA